ncbi:MAG: alpha/beta hydrolase-fold protein [Mycobacteriales bacterium]
MRQAKLILVHTMVLVAIGACSGDGGGDAPGGRRSAGAAAASTGSTAGKPSGGQPAESQSAPPTSLPSRESKVIAGTFESAALGKAMPYSVYLPAAYDEAMDYPVLYILAGREGDEMTWFSYLQLAKHADTAIASGEIKPLIIVSPHIANSFGINSGEGDFEDYIVRDVVAHVDATYSTVAHRSGRYIGGLSMGGYAALHAAFKHPDVFSKVGGHSAALWTDDWSQAGGEYGLKRFLYPDDATRTERDPLQLAKVVAIDDLKVWLDVGSEDDFGYFDGARQLNDTLKGRGIPVQYHERPGKHDGEYWLKRVPEYLRFYAGAT